MSSSSSSVPVEVPARQAGGGERLLRGPWLRILQALWLVLVLGDLATLVLSYPAFYQGLHSVCPLTITDCRFDQLTTRTYAALQQSHISLHTYALYVLILDIVTTCAFLVFGGLIFWRKPDTWMGIFVSFLLLNMGSLGPSLVHSDWLPEHGSLLVEIVGWEVIAPTILYYPTLAFFFFLFPDGRLVPRWSWTLIGLWVMNAVFFLLPTPFNITTWHPLFMSLWLFVVFGGSLGTQVYRYRRVATPTRRQQIKWLFYGYAPVFLSTVFGGLFLTWLPALSNPDSLLAVVLTPLYRFYYLPVPICVGMALLRYRLWDIDTIISRTMVYGSLTAILLGVYLLLIFTGQHLLLGVLGRNDPVILVVSTLLVAALVTPLRHRLQNFIDRRFYRQKYDATRILASFAETLHQEVRLDQLHTRLLAVIEETMQPAHISLWLCSPRRVPAIKHRQSEIPEAVLPEAEGSSP